MQTEPRSNPSLELLHDLGKRLAEHVQLEEREVLPLIEATIPEPELDALGDRLRHSATGALQPPRR